MKATDFEFLSRAEYFADLAGRIGQAGAGDRVYVASMSCMPEDPAVQAVIAAMQGAARRGAAVNLIVDAMEFLLRDGSKLGPLFFRGQLPDKLAPRFESVRRVLTDLEAAGGRYVIMNRPAGPYRLPLAGRSHIKFALINQRVYIGGCNLDSAWKIDVMTAWEDEQSAQWLRQLAERMLEFGDASRATGGQDLEVPVDEQSILLVDGGKRGRSIIMQRALELIDGADEHIFLTCQFYPNDVTARHLQQAYERGVKVEIHYNHPDQHPGLYKYLHRSVVRKARLVQPESFFVHEIERGRPFLHAKLIATDKGAIIGSHNFIQAGVKLGTAEIALLRHDPDFANLAAENIRSQLRK